MAALLRPGALACGLRRGALWPVSFWRRRRLTAVRPIAATDLPISDCFISNDRGFTTPASWGQMTSGSPEAIPYTEDHDVIASKRAPDRGVRRIRSRTDERRCRAGAGAGQVVRAQAVALGSALASAAEGDRGVGRLGGEGIQRHHQVQGVPGA